VGRIQSLSIPKGVSVLVCKTWQRYGTTVFKAELPPQFNFAAEVEQTLAFEATAYCHLMAPASDWKLPSAAQENSGLVVV
jgi:hypothetical protein